MPNQPYTVGEAFTWAWNKFGKNAGPLIVPVLILAAVAFVLYLIFSSLLFASMMANTTAIDYSDYDSDTMVAVTNFDAGTIIGIIVFYVVMLLIVATFASGYIGGVLDIANGQPVTIGSFLKPRNIGGFIVVTLIVGVVASLGHLVLVLPAEYSGSAALALLAMVLAEAFALAVGLFSMFSIIALLDRNLSPVDAIKHSIDVVKNNFGAVILAYLVSLAVLVVGAIACGVGLLVAVPVSLLFEVYTYRRLTNAPVAPLTP
ncbi:MAG: hypothetical protein U0R77_00685 [Mycolicibacterium insubricum]